MRLSKYLKKIDIFGATIEFYINKSSAFKSTFGGFLSLSMVFIFITICSFSLVSLINLEKRVIQETETFSPSEGNIEFSRSNFMFALGFSNKSYNVLEEVYFNISLAWRQNKRNMTTGSLDRTRIVLELEKCRPEHFPDNLDSFYSYGLNLYYCPKSDSLKYPISGFFTADLFEFLEIKLSRCNKTEHPNCVDSDKYEAFLKNDEMLRFEIYTTTNEIDSSNLNQPFKKYIISELYFLLDTKNGVYREADIFIKRITINSDYNILFPLNNLENKQAFLFEKELKEDFTFGQNGGMLAKFFIRKSLKVKVIERKFWTVAEFISFLGGIWGPMFFIFFTVGRYYNKKKYLLELAQKIYKLNQKDDDDRFRPSLRTLARETGRNHPEGVSPKRNGFMNPVLENSNMNITEELKRYLNSERAKFDLTPFDLILSDLHFCGLSDKKKKKLSVMKHAIKSISQDLDLVQILKSLQEHEKMKHLLFDENQLIMFNFSPKPQIRVDFSKKSGKKLVLWNKSQHAGSIFSLRNRKSQIEPPQPEEDIKQESTTLEKVTKVNEESNKRLFSDKENFENLNTYKQLLKAYFEMKKKKRNGQINQGFDIINGINFRLVEYIDKEVTNLKNIVNLTDEEFMDLFKSKNHRDLDRKFKNTFTTNSLLNLRTFRDFSGQQPDNSLDSIPQERNEDGLFSPNQVDTNQVLFTTESDK